MQSQLIDKPKKEKRKPEYPYLGIFPDGEVVLFDDENAGYSVHGGRPYYSTTWKEEKTRPLKGKIILSNDNET